MDRLHTFQAKYKSGSETSFGFTHKFYFCVKHFHHEKEFSKFEIYRLYLGLYTDTKLIKLNHKLKTVDNRLERKGQGFFTCFIMFEVF